MTTDMQVFLDDAPCEIKSTSVGSALAEAADIAERRGRMIIEVIVDGEQWGDQQFDDASMHERTAERVELISADPTLVLRETLHQSRDVLDEADRLHRLAAEAVQSDRMTDAMAHLDEAISIWLSVYDAVVKTTALLSIDLNELRDEHVDTAAAMERLVTQLQQVRQALADQDPVTLSDALAYELPDVVDEWKSVLALIISRIPADGSHEELD